MLFLFALVGMNQPSPAAVPGAANPQVSPQTKTAEDVRIEKTLRTKLAKSKMSADHFTFSVLKGVVTIEGNTGVMQHKGAMTRMAKTSGAASVHNNIRISDAAKAKAAATLAGHRATVNAGVGANPGPAPPPAPVLPASATPRASVLPPDRK